MHSVYSLTKMFTLRLLLLLRRKDQKEAYNHEADDPRYGIIKHVTIAYKMVLAIRSPLSIFNLI